MTGASSFRVAEHVAAALERGEAVVALESTVIAHGLPYPRSLEVARLLEGAVEEAGATAATIGVVDGVPVVGLGEDELERMATEAGVAKASVRDLGALAAGGRTAATTVAATAWIAHRAGIRVFATGGIGGVHRGGEGSMDVSADLDALARTPIAVVSAGAKAILDLERTLEALETRCVPVVGLGTTAFPAFYTRDSGLPLEHGAPDATGVAAILRAHEAIGFPTGVLVCVPPPSGAALDPALVSAWIARADREAAAAGIAGKDVTPWLLARLAEISEGRTVETNVALLENNAREGGRIAVALAGQERSPSPEPPPSP